MWKRRFSGNSSIKRPRSPTPGSRLPGLILLAFGLSAHADSAPIDVVAIAAIEFLALVDECEYEKSYLEASSVLREEVSQEEWVTYVRNLRDPLGQLNQRTLSSSDFHDSLPEAPPGRYVIFTYHSSFENNKFAAEVIAVAEGSDGAWRVVGYYFG